MSKAYGSVLAVRDLTLDIGRGSTVALLGPNGAGKSTTIAMLTGLVAPDRGSVAVCGQAPRAAVASGRIAVMLQDAGLMPGVTVAELVSFASRGYPAPLDPAEALDVAGLTDVAKRRVDRLSGGQVQRLRFAMVAVANSDVLVLDEPTRAMDVAGRREFWTAIRGYAAAGRTVLFATHYLDEVQENADRVVVMVSGSIVADATPDDLRRSISGSSATGAIRLASTIRVAVSTPEDTFTIRTMPGVADVAVDGGFVVIHTTDADSTVRALATSPIDWHTIAVSPPSLDESFLALTGAAGVSQTGSESIEVSR